VTPPYFSSENRRSFNCEQQKKPKFYLTGFAGKAINLTAATAKPGSLSDLQINLNQARGNRRWVPACGRNRRRRRRIFRPTSRQSKGRHMGRYALLWLLGVPIPILVLIWMFGGLH
jgi:hypothetical protein